MYKILVFGTGGLARFLVKHKREDVVIKAYVDSIENGHIIEGIPVVSLDEIKNIIYDYVVIAFSDIRGGKTTA